MMSAAFFIARRYFMMLRRRQGTPGLRRTLLGLVLSLFTFSPRRVAQRYQALLDAYAAQNFIRILSTLSMFGVGIGTGALVIVMSVFNGLEDLTRSLHRSFQSELRITARMGKSFVADSLLAEKIRQIPGVLALTEVIEDNALVRYGEAQMVIRLKGVSDNFLAQYPLDSAMLAGRPIVRQDSIGFALLGYGVQQQLRASLSNRFVPLQIWYPREIVNKGMDISQAFNKEVILPGGVFSIEQQVDGQYILVPVGFAARLIGYEGRLTSWEVATDDQTTAVKSALRALLGEDYVVEDSDEQQADLLRAVQIERLFTFATFALIIAIASFNIFFSLAMLVIEKQEDVRILRYMGATDRVVAGIFLGEGALIAFSGAGLGLGIGGLICWLQQQYGIFELLLRWFVDSSVISMYPVRMNGYDFVAAGLVVLAITLLSAAYPAWRATRMERLSH